MPRTLTKKRYSGSPVFSSATTSVADAVLGGSPMQGQNLDGKLSAIKAPNSTWSKVFGAADKIVPFTSNLINSFRGTPRPKAPRTIGYVNPVRVNYDADRYETDSQVRAANVSADRNLDANTAAAVKAANLASGLRAKNQISQSEGNQNAGLQMRTNQINADIDARNTMAYNRYQDQQVESQIASQRNSAANIANAADKYMLQQGEQDKANLDLKKLGILSRIYKDSGVYDRLVADLKKENKLAGGGPIKPAATLERAADPAVQTDYDLNKVKMNELLSYSLLNGGNPMEHDEGRMLFRLAEGAYGRPKAQQLFTDIALFGQDSNNTGLSSEEKIRRFYSGGADDSVRRQINIADPVTLYNTSPNIRVRRQQSLAKNKFGGSLKKVF